MKRVVAAVVVLSTALIGAIAWKIHLQDEAMHGPASGSGVVESEGVDVSARLSARVLRVLVEEGAQVQTGAVLIELECEEQEARLAEAQARLAAAQAQAEGARAQAEAARRQSSAARASIGAVRAQAGALDTQRDVALREAERVESLGEHAAIARRDQARAAADGIEAQTRAARASQVASSRQASAAVAQADAASLAADAAERSVRAMEAVVLAAEVAAGECRIRAPRSGVLERLYYEVGELVMPGATVGRIVDLRIVTAIFYLPNADIDEARVGMRARIEADAYPGRSFRGTVRRIALEAEFTPRNVQTRSDRDRLVYPVEVRIDNRDGALRSGMPVTVVLARRN